MRRLIFSLILDCKNVNVQVKHLNSKHLTIIFMSMHLLLHSFKVSAGNKYSKLGIALIEYIFFHFTVVGFTAHFRLYYSF